jgi:hypothetical protein
MLGNEGALWMTWPTDKRSHEGQGIAQIHLARIDTKRRGPLLPKEPEAAIARAAEPEPYFNEPTPPRPLTEHHTWTVGGKPTVSCGATCTGTPTSRTAAPASMAASSRHYRYAYDLAGLDFLGTSDHTDIAKVYSPYEWWHTQRQVDVFHAPGRLRFALRLRARAASFRGGTATSSSRNGAVPSFTSTGINYRNSQWQTSPVKAGLDQIQPSELWDVLKRHGQPVAIISHTGATGMGTDWTKYAQWHRQHL